MLAAHSDDREPAAQGPGVVGQQAIGAVDGIRDRSRFQGGHGLVDLRPQARPPPGRQRPEIAPRRGLRPARDSPRQLGEVGAGPKLGDMILQPVLGGVRVAALGDEDHFQIGGLEGREGRWLGIVGRSQALGWDLGDELGTALPVDGLNCLTA